MPGTVWKAAVGDWRAQKRTNPDTFAIVLKVNVSPFAEATGAVKLAAVYASEKSLVPQAIVPRETGFTWKDEENPAPEMVNRVLIPRAAAPGDTLKYEAAGHYKEA